MDHIYKKNTWQLFEFFTIHNETQFPHYPILTTTYLWNTWHRKGPRIGILYTKTYFWHVKQRGHGGWIQSHTYRMKAMSHVRAPVRYRIRDCTYFSHVLQNACVSKSGRLCWSIAKRSRSLRRRQDRVVVVSLVVLRILGTVKCASHCDDGRCCCDRGNEAMDSGLGK